jgi:hypothetical protein
LALPEPLRFYRITLKGSLAVPRKWRSEMCDKCAELDGKIAHYRKLASGISDRLTLDGIEDRIKEMEAQKVQFHPEQKP